MYATTNLYNILPQQNELQYRFIEKTRLILMNVELLWWNGV